MVQTTELKKDLTKIDFSIIPSLRCNLRCPFCMYDSSPDNDTKLNLQETKEFLKQIEWDKISSWGFYGGEPYIETSLYDNFINLIPKNIPIFIITNGSWTSSSHQFLEFFDWINSITKERRLSIVISGTPEHRKFQRNSLIETLSKLEGIKVKGNDDIHPMGRAYKEEWECTKKCIWHEQPIRLGIFPTGHIIMQNCNGVYPVVGTLNYKFKDVLENAINFRTNGCNPSICYNINDVIDIRFKLEREKDNIKLNEFGN